MHLDDVEIFQPVMNGDGDGDGNGRGGMYVWRGTEGYGGVDKNLHI